MFSRGQARALWRSGTIQLFRLFCYRRFRVCEVCDGLNVTHGLSFSFKVKSNRGLGFTVIGGEHQPKYPDADFDDDDRAAAGTLLQLKSIAPGGPADLDGRLRSGDALLYINEQDVLGFTHDQVIELFQKIHPGETVRLRICRGYSLPADATDPRAQVITTDAISASGAGMGNSGSLGRSRPRLMDVQSQSTSETRTTSMDTNDQEVAAAFAEQPSTATGPLYTLKIAKGRKSFGLVHSMSR